MEHENENLEVTVARLDERQIALGKVVDEIKDNHLVHIATDIKDLQSAQNTTNNRLAYWGGGIAAILFILSLYNIYVSANNGPTNKLQTTITTSLPLITSSTVSK